MTMEQSSEWKTSIYQRNPKMDPIHSDLRLADGNTINWEFNQLQITRCSVGNSDEQAQGHGKTRSVACHPRLLELYNQV